jgi:hypothetical protein
MKVRKYLKSLFLVALSFVFDVLKIEAEFFMFLSFSSAADSLQLSVCSINKWKWIWARETHKNKNRADVKCIERQIPIFN